MLGYAPAPSCLPQQIVDIATRRLPSGLSTAVKQGGHVNGRNAERTVAALLPLVLEGGIKLPLGPTWYGGRGRVVAQRVKQ